MILSFGKINNYHPDYLGVPVEKLEALTFSAEDCKTTIANEYGFKNWKIIKELETYYDQCFKKAVNALIGRNFEVLKKLIENDPSLVAKKVNIWGTRRPYCITPLATM